MTIKVYISGICGSHEVRKQQQRVLFILQSLPIDLQIVDITEPGREEDLTFMQEVAKKHNKKTQLPPQIFNGEDYCGDYADFEVANDDDRIMGFLKLESEAPVTPNGIESHQTNGISETMLENNSDNMNENHLGDEHKTAEIDSTEKENVEAKDLGDDTLNAESVNEMNQKDVEESNAEETAAVEENVNAASEEASEEGESE